MLKKTSKVEEKLKKLVIFKEKWEMQVAEILKKELKVDNPEE